MSAVLPIIEVIYNSGATLYAILRDRLTGKVFNTGTSLFETFNSANWLNYAVALAEQSPSGYYSGVRPVAVAGHLTSEVIYAQSGGTPSIADAPPFNLGYSAGDNVAAISGDAAAAPTNLQAALSTEVQGAIAAGVITTQSFPTTLTNTHAAAYQGRILLMTSGAAQGMAGLISNYTVASGVISLAGALAVAPSAADTFIII